ncbi:hypothetical protein BJ875DRAFT_494319 [Amylocarpus encephaloides]|uniref:Alcohol dehydrogenase-like C-terminal domain-containing protein n=1 Tax=Amylocarpus encephaloides TaxID=45428 RepID=A0A9P7YMP0_9HELO|nr:hypothetical protein BJ875DRAFT_494319 [Amylocarpus encephaloides]
MVLRGPTYLTLWENLGPGGLLCAYSALLRGATKAYSVDNVPQRLGKARSIGAIPIDFSHGPADAQILRLEPNGNVKSLILNQAVHVTRVDGGVGIVGAYTPKDIGEGTADEKKGILPFPAAEFLLKGLTMSGGVAKTHFFVFSKDYKIEDGAKAYRDFSEHRIIKAVFRFDREYRRLG